VFDVKRKDGGRDGRYTFPRDARGAERAKVGQARRHRVPSDMTLVSTRATCTRAACRPT
jgi:hypothetical protein